MATTRALIKKTATKIGALAQLNRTRAALVARTKRRLAALRALQQRRAARIAPGPPARREGLDYTGMAPATVHGLGAKFVMRYLSTPGNPKNITYTEAASLHRLGIAVGLVFETTANRSMAGYTAGAADARSAEAQRVAAGIPPIVIHFAVDFDARPAQIADYARGWHSVLGDRAGSYGAFAVVQYVRNGLGFKYAWQTYAWSRGQWFAGAQIQQYQNGAAYDHDRTIASNAGLWEPR